MEIPEDSLEALYYHKYVFEFQRSDEKRNVHGLCKTMTGFSPTLEHPSKLIFLCQLGFAAGENKLENRKLDKK